MQVGELQNDAPCGREKMLLPPDFGSPKPGCKDWWVVHELDFSPSYLPDSTYPTTGSNASQLPAGATTEGSAMRDPWSRGSPLAEYGYGSKLPVSWLNWLNCSHQVLKDSKNKPTKHICPKLSKRTWDGATVTHGPPSLYPSLHSRPGKALWHLSWVWLERWWKGFELFTVNKRRAFKEGIKWTRHGRGKACAVYKKVEWFNLASVVDSRMECKVGLERLSWDLDMKSFNC